MTFRRSLGVADAAAITFAILLSLLLLGDDRLTWATLAIAPLFVLIAKSMGLYDRDEHLLHKTTLDEVPTLLGLSTASALLLYMSGDLLVAGELGRGQIALAWGLLFVLLVALRAAARSLARIYTTSERCLFVGDRASAREFEEKLASSPSVNARLVGWLPIPTGETPHAIGPDGRMVRMQQIETLVDDCDVHRIILGPGPGSSQEFLDSVRGIGGNAIKVSVLPDIARIVSSSAEVDRLNGITLLGVGRYRITKSSHLIKRSFDCAASGLALVVLAPVMVVTAVAIRLDSPGPTLFRQTRAGRHGESFEMLKFRSMYEGSDSRRDELRPLIEADYLFKVDDDPRITRVGRVIRRLCIDELPQLVNVLRGEMSLVGPRPLILEEDQRIEGWHRRRLDLQPGITGPWQVLGSGRIPVREMVKLDNQYVADWSLWNDIRILLLTAGYVVRRGGQ